MCVGAFGWSSHCKARTLPETTRKTSRRPRVNTRILYPSVYIHQGVLAGANAPCECPYAREEKKPQNDCCGRVEPLCRILVLLRHGFCFPRSGLSSCGPVRTRDGVIDNLFYRYHYMNLLFQMHAARSYQKNERCVPHQIAEKTAVCFFQSLVMTLTPLSDGRNVQTVSCNLLPDKVKACRVRWHGLC